MNHRTLLIIGSRLHSEGYPRNQEIIEALKGLGYDLRWCALPYPAFFHRMTLTLRLLFIIGYTPFRWLYSMAASIYYRLDSRASYIYVPFPAYLDLPLAWVIGKLNSAPVIADIFLSIYNSLVQDRQIFKKCSIHSQILYYFERLLLCLPDKGLIDTPEHGLLLKRLFKLPKIKLSIVPIGINDDLFSFTNPPQSSKAIFWGTYIKLHGIDTIIQAAAELARTNPELRIEMIGKGQELCNAKQQARELGASNIDFVDRILPTQDLVTKARSAFCVLGIFGTTSKSASVFPYKAVQALALGRPLITARTPASCRWLQHEHNALLIPPGNAKALAQAILRLYQDTTLGKQLAQNGQKVFNDHFSRKKISQALQEILRSGS